MAVLVSIWKKYLPKFTTNSIFNWMHLQLMDLLFSSYLWQFEQEKGPIAKDEFFAEIVVKFQLLQYPFDPTEFWVGAGLRSDEKFARFRSVIHEVLGHNCLVLSYSLLSLQPCLQLTSCLDNHGD